jgi:metal-responsive CopG/Arc/MetJ family transcriptional regulator
MKNVGIQESIAVGISLPKKIMSQIDSERGDVSRSRFLLRLIERQSIVSNVETKNVNDPLDHGIETPRSSESRD